MKVVIIADDAERAAPDFPERVHHALHAALDEMAKGREPDRGQRVVALEELEQLVAGKAVKVLPPVFGEPKVEATKPVVPEPGMRVKIIDPADGDYGDEGCVDSIGRNEFWVEWDGSAGGAVCFLRSDFGTYIGPA